MDDTAIFRAYIEANRRVQAEAHGNQQIPLGVLNTFLGVAIWGDDKAQRGEPATLEDLAEKLGMAPTTISQNIRYLSDKYRKEDDGLDLVTTEIYPLNRRKKTFRLTHKGRALASQIAYILGRAHDAGASNRETVPSNG